MSTNSTQKTVKPSKALKVRETQKFLEILEASDQVQSDQCPLKPGATHVLVQTPDGTKQLVRRRFSAL